MSNDDPTPDGADVFAQAIDAQDLADERASKRMCPGCGHDAGRGGGPRQAKLCPYCQRSLYWSNSSGWNIEDPARTAKFGGHNTLGG